tara:strand:- start:385 stop:1014 length:630 start_codon:yes stop_codon:yes gene_type:complete
MSTLTVGTIAEKVTDAGVAVDGVTLKDGGATFTSAVGVTGNATITSGNLVIGTAGKGIDFSVNSSASGMASELLDHYEEGTFDVTVRDATSGGNTGSVTQTNKYTRIGNKVWLQFNLINITTTGMTGGNALYFTDLPFTPITGSNGCGSVLTNHVDIDNNVFDINLFQNAGQNYMAILQARDATGSSTLVVNSYDNANADVFGTYMIEV